jgi:hypothetical protein
MFIPIEHLEEEIFPLAYLAVFSLTKDLKDYDNVQPFKLKIDSSFSLEKETLKSGLNRQLKRNEYKFVEKSVRDICRLNGCRLRAFKIIDGRILMVISVRSNPKTKFNSNNNGIDIQAFSLKILSKTKALEKLEKFYCLWKNQQINSAIDYVNNGKVKSEFDLRQ